MPPVLAKSVVLCHKTYVLHRLTDNYVMFPLSHVRFFNFFPRVAEKILTDRRFASYFPKAGFRVLAVDPRQLNVSFVLLANNLETWTLRASTYVHTYSSMTCI